MLICEEALWRGSHAQPERCYVWRALNRHCDLLVDQTEFRYTPKQSGGLEVIIHLRPNPSDEPKPPSIVGSKTGQDARYIGHVAK